MQQGVMQQGCLQKGNMQQDMVQQGQLLAIWLFAGGKHAVWLLQQGKVQQGVEQGSSACIFSHLMSTELIREQSMGRALHRRRPLAGIC